MDVMEMLEGYGELTQKLESIRQELDACRKRMKKEPEDLERLTSRVSVLEAEARLVKRQIKARQRKIQLEFMKLSSMNERKVMTMRYLDGMTFKEISDSTSFSTRSIYRMHSRAAARLKETKKTDHDTLQRPPA